MELCHRRGVDQLFRIDRLLFSRKLLNRLILGSHFWVVFLTVVLVWTKARLLWHRFLIEATFPVGWSIFGLLSLLITHAADRTLSLVHFVLLTRFRPRSELRLVVILLWVFLFLIIINHLELVRLAGLTFGGLFAADALISRLAIYFISIRRDWNTWTCFTTIVDWLLLVGFFVVLCAIVLSLLWRECIRRLLRLGLVYLWRFRLPHVCSFLWDNEFFLGKKLLSFVLDQSLIVLELFLHVDALQRCH